VLENNEDIDIVGLR